MKTTSGLKIKNKEKFPLLIRVKMGFGFTPLIQYILSCALERAGHFCIDLEGMKLCYKPCKIRDTQTGGQVGLTP